MTVICEENNVPVLELNVSAKSILMKQVWLNENSAQSTMSSSSRKINKGFWTADLFTWIVKDYQLLCTIVL